LQNSFKGGLIATFFTAAKSSLGTMLGPLIVGTVAGCGGAVIWGPSGWGKDGCPKPIWSSLMAALFFALSTDPSYTALLPISVPQLTTDDATVRTSVSLILLVNGNVDWGLSTHPTPHTPHPTPHTPHPTPHTPQTIARS
jgi:hypothetical protein